VVVVMVAIMVIGATITVVVSWAIVMMVMVEAVIRASRQQQANAGDEGQDRERLHGWSFRVTAPT
jgi:hypothetical protein